MQALQQLPPSNQPSSRAHSKGTLLSLLPPLDISCTVSHASDNGNQRRKLEDFIAERFSRAHGATVTDFMPHLVGLHCHDRLSATAGIRTGAEGHLFTETYLDKPLEQVLSETLALQIARDDVVEIGNLAAAWRGPSQLLFVLLAAALHKAGYQWVVFVATAQVQQLIRRLGFNSTELCRADPARLGAKQHQWGSYYRNQPVVITGELQHSMDIASATPRIRLLLDQQQALIARLSEEIGGKSPGSCDA